MTRLYLRIILSMAGVVVGTVLVLLVFLASVEKSYFRPRSAEEMRALARELDERLQGLSAEEARTELAAMGDRIVFDVAVIEGHPLPESSAASGGEGAFHLRPDGAPFVLRLAPDSELMARFQRRQGGYLIRSLGIIALMVLVSGLILVLPLVRRLREQERTILRIAEGDLDARAPVDPKDALGRLALRLNEMADRIRGLLAGQRELIHAVSHELRTPAARIGFGLDLLADAATDDERRRRIAALQDDLSELDQLLDELLTFLRVDDVQAPLDSEPVAMGEVASRLRDRARAFRGEVELEFIGDPDARVAAHPRLLPRALENVLLNAVRHAKSRVEVSWSAAPGEGAGPADFGLGINVDDDGPGIPDADLERIFDPFVRLDESRDRSSGGAGLGLSIARRIVERHGGTLSVDRSPLGGARFRFLLPQAPS